MDALSPFTDFIVSVFTKSSNIGHTNPIKGHTVHSGGKKIGLQISNQQEGPWPKPYS